MGYGIGLIGAILVMLGLFELSKKFGTPLFQIGGVLLLVGMLATLAAAVSIFGTLASGDLLGAAASLGLLLYVSLIAIVGWILTGIGFVVRKAQVAQALGAGQETLVLLTGIFLILIFVPIIGLIGYILLILIFFRLSKGAPAAAAPAA